MFVTTQERFLLPITDESRLRSAIEQLISTGINTTLEDVMALWIVFLRHAWDLESYHMARTWSWRLRRVVAHCETNRQENWTAFLMVNPWNQISAALQDGMTQQCNRGTCTCPIFVCADEKGRNVLIASRISGHDFIVSANPIDDKTFRKSREIKRGSFVSRFCFADGN